MGLGAYEGALDISRRLGDSELELYALVIYREAVGIDIGISGAEKTEKLKSLDGQIDALEKNLERDLEMLTGTEGGFNG
jgi:uncharacterized membrane protein YukC